MHPATVTDTATLVDIARHALTTAGLRAITWIDECAGVAYIDADPATSSAVHVALAVAGIDTDGTRRVMVRSIRPEIHRIPLVCARDRVPVETV